MGVDVGRDRRMKTIVRLEHLTTIVAITPSSQRHAGRGFQRV